jgi:glycosyltransferase involved in cell wall biosynthesis
VRNVIIEKSGSDDLIFVDSDCLIPPQSIHRLILGAEMGGDIIGGISVLKLDDAHPNLTAFSYTESGKGVNISLVNKEMPLTLLFPTWLIGKRWFVTVVSTGLSYYRSLVFDKLRFELDPEINEDVLLCLKANDLGFKIVADFGLWYEHYPLKYKIFDIPDYRWKLLFYLPFERKGKRLTLSLKVVDLLRQHFNFNYTDSTKVSKMWSNRRVPIGKKEEFKKDDNMFEKW